MRYFLCFFVFSAVPLLGCGDATGAIRGGDSLFDSGTPGTGDDGGGGDGPTTIVTSPDCLEGGTHQGNGWQDLYACYFGPTGVVSCALSGCHASSTDNGTLGSHGYVCPPTAADACLSGMKAAMPAAGLLVPMAPTSDPTSFHLYKVLCQVNVSEQIARMPLGCPVHLRSGDMSRIAAWIQGGAQNN